MNKDKTIFMIAGETSGDLHGAHLAREIKKNDPELKLCGAGGNFMQNAGVNIYYNLVDLSVVGFWEVMSNLRKFKEIFKLLCLKLDEVKPNAVVLIDYPGFNLRFAREVKKRNIKLIYYISPQVWAWGRNRIKLIKELVDKMVVIFKFEEELYKSHGLDVEFVGHPLLDIVKPASSRKNLIKQFGLSPDKKTIALLPGSRAIEVNRHLPIFLETCKILNKNNSDLQFVLSKSPGLSENLFSYHLNHHPLTITTVINSYDCIELADFVLVASGTATLETAILEKPMAIIYKTSFLTWALAKPQIKIPYIGLVNVVLGKKAVPEFLQYSARPRKIAEEIADILSKPERLTEIENDLLAVKKTLGSSGAVERAAAAILKIF